MCLIRSFVNHLLVLLVCSALVLAGCQDPSAAYPGLLSGEPSYAALVPDGLGKWDSTLVHAPSVVKIDGEYLLWYDGTNTSDLYRGWSIGLATSRDGSAWSRWQGNPVLGPGAEGGWDGVSVHDPRVIRDGQRFLMWYSGFDGRQWRVGLATSEDGRQWTKSQNNPVLEPGQPGSWDDTSVAYSSVILSDGMYRMWYQGGDSRGTWRIGHATSTDGIRWDKSSANPVLYPGSQGEWDNERVFTPTVVQTRLGYLLLYTGGPGTALGYALSEDGVSWRKDPRGPAITVMAGAQILTLTALQEGDKLGIWFGEQRDGRLTIRRTSTTIPIKARGP